MVPFLVSGPGCAPLPDDGSIVSVPVESPDPSSTRPRRRIAHRVPAPVGARTHSLRTEEVDLVEHARGPTRSTAASTGGPPLDEATSDGTTLRTIEAL